MAAILLANFVWEVLSTDPWPTAKQGAMDGQFLKQLDTGECYVLRYGKWESVNLGLSFLKATKSGCVITDGDGYAHVTFNTPFIGDDYTATLSPGSSPWPYMCSFDEIKKDGFDVYTRDTRNGAAKGNALVSWQATRNYNP